MEFIQRYTAFERRDLDTHINYRKKAGLLAAVNAAAALQAEDAQQVERARRELDRPPVDTDFDLHAPAPATARGRATP
jgi:hypothetical protein